MLPWVKILTPLLPELLFKPMSLIFKSLELIQHFCLCYRTSSEKLSTAKCRWILKKWFSRMTGWYKESRRQANWIICSVNLPAGILHSLFWLVWWAFTREGFIFHMMLVIYWKPEGWQLLWIIACLLSLSARELKQAVYTVSKKLKSCIQNGCH